MSRSYLRRLAVSLSPSPSPSESSSLLFSLEGNASSLSGAIPIRVMSVKVTFVVMSRKESGRVRLCKSIAVKQDSG